MKLVFRIKDEKKKKLILDIISINNWKYQRRKNQNTSWGKWYEAKRKLGFSTTGCFCEGDSASNVREGILAFRN